MRAHQRRQHFYVKTTLNIHSGVGARDLYLEEAHTTLDIFRFAAFFSDFFKMSVFFSKICARSATLRGTS